jgi:hypothetical protein
MLMLLLVTSLNLFARDAQAPDMALLEFIGDSVPAGDELVDPMDWQAMQGSPMGQDTTQASAGSRQAPQQGHSQLQQRTDKRKSGK